MATNAILNTEEYELSISGSRRPSAHESQAIANPAAGLASAPSDLQARGQRRRVEQRCQIALRKWLTAQE